MDPVPDLIHIFKIVEVPGIEPIIIIIIIIIIRYYWKNRMDLEERGVNAGNWVDSAQDRDYSRALVNAALNLRLP